MNKISFQKLLDFRKHYTFPYLTSFVIVCVHFVITPMLETPYDNSLKFIVWIMLVAPGYYFAITLASLPFIGSFLDGLATFLIVAGSSFFYGITGGLLVSNNKNVRMMGLIFVGVLILMFYFLLAVFGQSFA